jgi:hypothetical protein
MRCLETRPTGDGFRRRRYEADDGTRHTTIEVPMQLWREMVKASKPALPPKRVRTRKIVANHDTAPAPEFALHAAWRAA